MDRGSWWATVHGVARAEHDLAAKPLLLLYNIKWQLKIFFFFGYTGSLLLGMGSSWLWLTSSRVLAQ